MSSAPKPVYTPEIATAYRDLLIGSMERELATTNKVIAAIPENKRDFRPEPNARTAWDLAWHLVSGSVLLLVCISKLKFQFGGGFPEPKSFADMVTWYEENFVRATKAVRSMSAEQLLTPVDFFGVIELPVFMYLLIVNNQIVHHRGQLSTYLRPMGSKVPSIYGGSYDEPFHR